MADSTALISGQQAWCDISVDSVHKIFNAFPPFGPILANVILGPLLCAFAGTLGKIGGASLDRDTLNALPLQTMKNIYVAGLLGFYLVFGPLSQNPEWYPVAVIGGGINSIMALMVAVPFGVFADLLSPPWRELSS